AQNAGILAAQILATHDVALYKKVEAFKNGLREKVISANEKLK
ncbi:MAG: hypothetical protein RIQ47_1680, partial [Bacteroidota bacterium]